MNGRIDNEELDKAVNKQVQNYRLEEDNMGAVPEEWVPEMDLREAESEFHGPLFIQSFLAFII